MKKIIVLVVCAVLCTAVIYAQDPVKPACPSFSVSVNDQVKEGESAFFSLMVSGAKTDMTMNWSISAGTIEKGQGTAVIEVNTTGLGNQSITATIDIGGLDRSCSNSSSATIMVAKNADTSLLITKGVYINDKALGDAVMYLIQFHIRLSIDAYTKGAVFIYPGKKASDFEINAIISNVKKIFESEKVMPTMYTIDRGGRMESTSYEIWAIPSGAREPLPKVARVLE